MTAENCRNRSGYCDGMKIKSCIDKGQGRKNSPVLLAINALE